MAETILCTAHGSNIAASLTRFFRLGTAHTNAQATEADAEVRWRSAGTLTNLYARIRVNDRAASTIRLRVNTVNGNQILSIGGSATGEFEDTVNTDSISAADDTAYQVVTGAGGTDFTFAMISSLFDATTNTVQKFSISPGNFAADDLTFFLGLASLGNATNVEAEMEVLVNAGGTIENLYVFVLTNNRSGSTTTFGSRVNGGAGGLSVSVVASATGIFEDTAGSDTLSADDLINAFITTGAGGGTITYTVAVELTSTDETFHLCSRNDVGITFGNVRYSPLGGRFNRAQASTDFNMTIRRAAGVISNLTSFHNINGGDEAVTVALQVNDTDELSYSVSAASTGRFEDTTGSVNVVSTDDVRHKIDHSASTVGNFEPGPVVVMVGPAPAVAAIPFPSHDFGLIRVPGKVLAY